MSYEIVPIGKVESPLTDKATAPKQGHEGSPEATLVFEERVLEALDGLAVGDEVILLTWLDRADRDVLKVHPRSDPANPIGLHQITIAAIDGNRMRVRDLEALDGTPIVDVKPVI